jgi:hypothetical protein
LHGFLPMRSPRFRELARICNWTILPTCSEGQPGSVLECMAHGLIPILPDEANISLGNIGVRLPDCSPGTIRSIISGLVKWSPASTAAMIMDLLRVVAADYSSAGFICSFAEAVKGIQSMKREIGPRQEVQAAEW